MHYYQRWQKRRVSNAIKRRKQEIERRHKLNQDLDRWQTETTAQETPRKKPKKKSKANTPDLKRLVALLEDLRDLRRKRLEAQGHFFPDAGDEFYHKIKASEEERGLTDGIEKESENDSEKHAPLYIHPEDNTPSLDQTAYRFWAQGLQTTKALLRVRNQWDMFLDDSEGTQIPPTWVTPTPPTNWIWASYLDLNP
ncbi:hypothetical protein BX666DRAFT_1916113 [Dichotomocladium elegans]|nr:hypothetical protein BX666DRAFT_1916113 [Dichotomocladium elegans]